MPDVEFTWYETDPARPARDVLVRLIAFDSDYQDPSPYLLERSGGGVWRRTISLPDGLRSSYQLCPVRDFSIPPSGVDDELWAQIMAVGIPDPHNDRAIGPCTYGNRELASILEVPGALPQPWCERRPGATTGRVRSVETGVEWPSAVQIYTPPSYEPATGPWPVAVLFDAQFWKVVDVTATFDNLIADGAVPPFLAAMLANPPGPTRVRGLTRPDLHRTYLLDELMPWLVDEFNATVEPDQTILVGQSLGALAAVACAVRAPERFGNVVCQSGSFWWPGGADGELRGADVLAWVAANATRGQRYWVEAGRFERTLVGGSRELRDALAARGLDVAYREYTGGHDVACWRGGLGDGVVALWGV